MKTMNWLAGLAAALGLTACSGGPSTDDAKQAIATLLQQSGAGQVTDVRNFELSGCKKAEGADGYRCDTRGEIIVNVMGRQLPLPINKSIRYAKADGTWRAYAQ